MKRKTSPKTIYKYLLLTLIAFTSLLFFGFGKSSDINSQNGESLEDQVPVAINHLLSNELSNLPATTKLDSQIDNFMKKWEINGASLAIMKDEKLIYAKGYGWANLEENIETEVRHIFRIASLSKLITAVAIMKLYQEGKLSLEDNIFGSDGHLNYLNLSQLRDKRVKEITIEHLLRHKGGFSTRAGDPMFSLATISKRLKLNRAVTEQELIEYVLTQRLGFTPGTGTRYSNLGYFILSKVIEAVTGQRYDSYIQDSILKPNGIYDMHLARNFYKDKYPNEVKYYEPSNEEPISAFDGRDTLLPRCYGGNNIEMLLGAGAWVASPVEMLKFISLIDGRDGIKDILSKESVNLMTFSTPATLPIGWAKCYPSGNWTRTGTLSGSSALIKYNSNGYSWVFITNTSSWKGSTFPKNIDGFFRGAMQRVSEWPERDLFKVTTASPAKTPQSLQS
ncbi:MAG: serine hydrolase domain-containing protein [Bacteroidales bacterium]